MKKKVVSVIQSNYAPWPGYFEIISESDIFVIYDTVKYTKGDWRNRNIIFNRDRNKWITIPVSSNSVNLSINEVLPLNSEWKNKHLLLLKDAYRKAPFLCQLMELLESTWLNTNIIKLTDVNESIIRFIANKLRLNTLILRSEDFLLPQKGRIDKLLSICQQLSATKYLSGPSAQIYLSESIPSFKESGIELCFHNYGTRRQYMGPDRTNLSIYDLIAYVSWDDMMMYIRQK